MAADDLEDEIQILQAGEERRGSGCCFDPAMVELVFACGAVHAENHIKARQYRMSSSEGLRPERRMGRRLGR